jgi:hypothetical protein
MTTLNQVLISNGSTTGSAVSWAGGFCAFSVEGTFGGTTAALEAQTANGTWIAVGTETTKTANGWGGAFLPPCNIRCSLTGGAPSAIYAYANQMPTPTSQYTMGN